MPPGVIRWRHRELALRIFVTRWFEKFAIKKKVSTYQLCEAIARAELGLINAQLGGGLIKQRVARKGEGRSGGFRTVIAYRTGVHAIFLYGFGKNERDNIDVDDFEDLKKTASILLAYGKDELARTVAAGELKEIVCDA